MTININVIHGSPQHEQIMIKLSELAATVTAVEAKVDSIGVKLDAFLAVAADPPIPADAEAGLARSTEKLALLESKIPAAA